MVNAFLRFASMRRSLAPSQRNKLLENKASDAGSSAASASSSAAGAAATDGEVIIQRLPLFGFLEIPKALSRQFKIPSGCLLTEKSIALRKIKRLGPSKNFHIVRPGDYANALVKHTGLSPDESGDGDNEAEDLPTASTNLPPFEPLVLWSHPEDAENKVEVIPQLACKLRPHQREGVQFLFECTMGLRGFEGEGCILADDMGLGKTLMSITLLWTLLNQGFSKAPGSSAVRKIVVVCPTSLVGNWDNEIRKWVGEHCPTFAVKTDPKKMIKTFLQHRGKGVLIVSYETQRLYSKLFEAAAKPSILNKSAAAASDNAGSDAGASALEQAAHGPGVDSTTTDPVRLLRVHSNNNVCDLLICDEAHKLKNADSGLAKSLNLLPARKRILLSGTPMQNELTEFYNMVNFCNPMVLGTNADFKRRYERPILASREPDAIEKQTAEAGRLQKELSTIVNEFILKRGNILNAQHLPPKLVQFVCCRLTPLQETLYNHLLNSKEIRHAREGKQLDTLGAIRQLINICSHPKLLVDTYNAKRACNEPVSEELVELVNMIKSYNSNSTNSGASSSGTGSAGAGAALAQSKPSSAALTSGFTRMGVNNPGKVTEMRNFSLKKGLGASSSGSAADRVDPELSGKMGVLCRMMQTMRASRQPGQQGERIVVVSNYTQTLDLIQQVCVQSNWPVLRLDGSISAGKRTKLVDDFNNPASGAFVFLLSSKAGGCGINLIGGSRLVLFDPDWNPASDKQAAARIWREGQKRRCFIYRFMSTGSIEEKIIQRQLSKEGLADIVDDKEQVNQFSSDELRDLFSLRHDTASDTHDTLRCKRCNSVKVREASKKGGKTVTFTPAQADACVQFLNAFVLHLQQEAAAHIVKQCKSGAPAPLAINPSSPETIVLPFAPEIEALKDSLRTNGFASLPVYSKIQREVMQGIDETLQQARAHKPAPPTETGVDGAVQSEEDKPEAEMIALYKELFPNSFSIFPEFLNRWVEAVPALTLLGKTTTKSSSSGNLASAAAGSAAVSTIEGGDAGADAEETFEGEFVEQEGCPDDTDFNRWSHHCGVNSCDDELLSRALADDNTVSFVFGLEVNWSLLESREALLREENEHRKEQQRMDLEALNEQRRLKREQLAAPKAGKASKAAGSDPESDGDGRGDDQVVPLQDKSDHQATKKKAAKKPAAEKKAKRPLDDADGGAGEPPSKVPKCVPIKKAAPVPPSIISAVSSPGPSAPTASRRAVHIAVIDPLLEIDETFRADWEYLRRTHSKGKLDLANFAQVLKQLKQFNNNWRVVPADYRDVSAEIMWTRMPGLKKETCSLYRCGFDYFPTEEQLKQFICAQAGLLGDGELTKSLQSEQEVQVVTLDEPSEHTALPAKKAPRSGVKAPTAACKRLRIQSDSECDVEVVVVVESAKKRKITAPLAPCGVTAEDINFSDTSDDSDQGTKGGAEAARSSVPHKATSAAPAPIAPRAGPSSAGVRLGRRVIADDGDEEDATMFLAAVSLQQAAQAPLSSSKPKLAKKFTPAKAPKHASSVPVFDLTMQPTPEQAPSSALKGKPRTAQKENTHPNPASRQKVSAAVQGCSQHTADSQDSAAEGDNDHSLGHSSHSGSDGGGGSLKGSVSGSSEEWTCTFCTLENSVITDPTECSVCGNRRSFNTRPKRAVASQISQIY